MFLLSSVLLQFWCQRVSSSPSRVVTVRLILHLQNNILLSRRSVPYQVQGYRTRHVRRERKGGRHHLCARVQPTQSVHRHACRSVEYVRFLFALPFLWKLIYIALHPVFFGCCIVGAAFTTLLPEVRGRDPDVIYQQELDEAAAQQHQH